MKYDHMCYPISDGYLDTARHNEQLINKINIRYLKLSVVRYRNISSKDLEIGGNRKKILKAASTCFCRCLRGNKQHADICLNIGLVNMVQFKPPSPVIHYWPFQGGSSVSVLRCLFWCQSFGDVSLYVFVHLTFKPV